MKRPACLAMLGLSALPLLLCSACATGGKYFGIDVGSAGTLEATDPEREKQVRERNLLMLIATVQGCYTREDGGFGPVPAAQARSFECARVLAEVENRSAALGLGRAPGGIWALNLQTLARLAHLGDKNAQLELGIRFEEGIGLEHNSANACRLYGKAAAQTGGTIWVYSPPVGNGTSGRVMPIDTGPVIPGLSQARERLDSLKARGGC